MAWVYIKRSNELEKLFFCDLFHAATIKRMTFAIF